LQLRACATIAALDEMDIDYVIPLHCSGEMFYDLAKAEMPSKLLRSYTGTRFVFMVSAPNVHLKDCVTTALRK
jgi:metal-dependent hydrolase (beta-lactamase superfamily II)